MTLLAADRPGPRTIAVVRCFLAERPGHVGHCPDAGLPEGEIEVLGYRGMKEGRTGFDGFAVKRRKSCSAGSGKGFQAADATFESADPDAARADWRGAIASMKH